MDIEIVLIAHNIRSMHNVGSLLRTADGLGVNKVYLTGYSPYPIEKNDSRLPHIRLKINNKISKTALGAESSVDWEHRDDIFKLLFELKNESFELVALEQSDRSIKLEKYTPKNKVALIIGREVEGIEDNVLSEVDVIVEIPMLGSKESFNVVQAAAMAVYRLRYA